MRKKRLIAVFSGNRAEYGLQYPILKAIKNHPDLEYKLIVSGAHLDNNFGATISEIKKDGFEIYAEVKIDMNGEERTSTSRAIASGITNLIPVLHKLNPDIFVVYADRFEGLAAVVASSQMNIPTAHIEGGDITEGGALDDSVRHAMTKFAHLHYTTNIYASNRLLAMGEDKWRVNTVGFPAIDLIINGSFESPENLFKKLNLNPQLPIVLFTQHSVTTEFADAPLQIEHSLTALKKLALEGVQIILTYPNNDAGGELITRKLLEVKEANFQLHKSLGRYTYHGILALAKDSNLRVACVGNSSSGIKETPIFGCPTLNIGTRQLGRLRGENVLDANYDEVEIYQGIKKCLFDENFRDICTRVVNPYGGGHAGELIAESLSKVNLEPQIILRKGMNLEGLEKDGWYK